MGKTLPSSFSDISKLLLKFHLTFGFFTSSPLQERNGGRQKSPKTPYTMSHVVKQLRLAAGMKLVINLTDLNFSKCPLDVISAIDRMLVQTFGVDVIFISTSILRTKDANIHRKELSKIPDNQFPNVVYVGGPPFSATINILPPPNPEARSLWESQMEKRKQEVSLPFSCCFFE